MGHPNGRTRPSLDQLVSDAVTCPAGCECHSSPFSPCSVPGGCGSEGCNQPARGGGCTTCRIYDSQTAPGRPERGKVCDRCRMRLSRCIEDIGRLHTRLVNPDPVEYDHRWYQARYTIWDETADAWIEHVEDRRTDPLAAFGGVAGIPSRNRGAAVSGSRERSAPTSLDALDLTRAARHLNLTRDPVTGLPNQQPDDEAGHLSAATVLAEIVADWRETLWPGQHLPESTVSKLVAWLRAGADFDEPGTRIDEACDRHPAIADTAEELRQLRSALRRACGETVPQPELIDGVACRSCDLRALYRMPGDSYRAECGACGLLYTDDEFARWTGLLAMTAKAIRAETR